MAPTPFDGVELLERSLGHARVVLSEITDADLARATRCPPWSVADLLDHVEDGLDAFTEAAAGRVALTPARGPAPVRVARLADKACHLLGVWSAAPDGLVRLGDRRLPAGVLAGIAALEVSVHASDAASCLGRGPRLPETLAEDLWPLASRCVDDADRGRRFGPALRVGEDCDAVTRLLAHLGRGNA